MFNFNRRDFLKGIAATAAFSPFGGMKLFAADGDDGKTPNLRFGVVSDVHITVAHNVETWEKTIQWFKEQDVDAVLVAGDIADRGLLSELKDFSDSWYKIFPDDKGLNGKHVEKIFVCGNHDVEGFRYGKWKQRSKEDQDKIFQKTVIKDLPAAWDLCFHEEFKPIYAKQVKGYTFIGGHFSFYQKQLGAFMEGYKSKIDPDMPFFYTQHQQPGNTNYGPWCWGNDNGIATRALSPFPNAIAFTGHSHYPLTDESGIWQGAFTSIGTASLRYCISRYGRENGNWQMKDQPVLQMAQPNAYEGRHGMLVSVYDDHINIKRREFVFDESLGPDWNLPLPINKEQPYSRERKVQEGLKNPPQFAEDAAGQITVTEAIGPNRSKVEVPQVTVEFPPAATGVHTYDYEVRAERAMHDMVRIYSSKRVLPDKFFLGPDRQDKTVKCVFALSELPVNANLRFAITPIDCFGCAGKTIYTKEMKLGVKPAEPKPQQ